MQGARLEVYEAQAQAHGQAIPFLPVLQMMRGYFGIEDRDSERVAREKIAGRLLLLDPDFADDLPLVFDFLAVPDPERPAPQVSAEARERLLRGVIRRLYRVPDPWSRSMVPRHPHRYGTKGNEVFRTDVAEDVVATEPLRVLREVIDAVKVETGIVISVGIGPSRLVAKCCSDLGKPAGFVAMGREEACVRFATAPTSRIPGIGPKTADRLAEVGVRTIGQLQNADEARLATRFGTATPRAS